MLPGYTVFKSCSSSLICSSALMWIAIPPLGRRYVVYFNFFSSCLNDSLFGFRGVFWLSTILIRFFLLDISAPLVVITADPDLGLQVSSTQTFESNCDLLKSVTCFSGVYTLFVSLNL